MNRTERLMLAILREPHSLHGVTYVRAEVEAEGLRMEVCFHTLDALKRNPAECISARIQALRSRKAG